jgi:membrane protein
MNKVKSFWKALKAAAIGFSDDNAFKLSASLSYYTIFALGPLLIIIISLVDIFYGRDAVEGRIYGQLSGLLGGDAAKQIENIIINIQQTNSSTTGAIIGALILFIGATGVFTEMQDSLNYIWSVKAKPKKGWKKFIMNRLLSFSLIVGLGFLLLVSLVINAVLTFVSNKLLEFLPDYTIAFFQVINTAIILVVITGLFTVIFKVLPDAIISWKDALMGAMFTATLFLAGKFLIGFYIGRSNLGVTYGTAASIVIILSWVYYSALILYFGAEFTKMFALQSGSGIKPKETAVFIIKKETKEIPASHLDT